jgi:hypothetical protein
MPYFNRRSCGAIGLELPHAVEPRLIEVPTGAVHKPEVQSGPVHASNRTVAKPPIGDIRAGYSRPHDLRFSESGY